VIAARTAETTAATDDVESASATGHIETAESPDLGDERQIRRL
jgi:hypothetical protein